MTATINASTTAGVVTTADTSGILQLQTNGTAALTIDASQNVGIGTASPNYLTTFFKASLPALQLANSTSGTTGSDGLLIYLNGANATISNEEAGFLVFQTSGTERARITSTGLILMARTTTSSRANTATLQVAMSGANQAIAAENTSATPYGIDIYYSGAAPNSTGSSFIECADTGATRFTVRSNGGIANFSANNVNLSDRREKTNFAPAKSYLDVICAIPVQTFNYIDQNLEEDDGLTLGVVAQDVQAVAPEMVMESNWGTQEDPKMRLSIYQTDLQYALMKSIQELKAIVDGQAVLIAAQGAEIAALKGAAA